MWAKYNKANPFHVHQVKIARQTLAMSDAMVGVMGGPSKSEARATLAAFGLALGETCDK